MPSFPVDRKLALYAYICGKTSFLSPDPEIQGPENSKTLLSSDFSDDLQEDLLEENLEKKQPIAEKQETKEKGHVLMETIHQNIT